MSVEGGPQGPSPVESGRPTQFNQYSNKLPNGAESTVGVYGIDAEGNHHTITDNDILMAHGHDPSMTPGSTPVEAVQADPTDQERLKAHANWQMRVDTTDKKPSERGLTAEDIAYNMWLSENATEASGQSLSGRIKADAAAAAEATRREALREKARFNMRVKTGQASGEDTAYYYTLKEMEDAANTNKTTTAKPGTQKPGAKTGSNDGGKTADDGGNKPNDDGNKPAKTDTPRVDGVYGRVLEGEDRKRGSNAKNGTEKDPIKWVKGEDGQPGVKKGQEIELYKKGEIVKKPGGDIKKPGDGEQLPPPDFNVELPPSFQRILSAARQRYINANADKRRVGFGKKKELAAAQKEYEDRMREGGAYIALEMKDRGMTETQIKRLGLEGFLLEGLIISTGVKGKQDQKRFLNRPMVDGSGNTVYQDDGVTPRIEWARDENGNRIPTHKKTDRFLDWWARNRSSEAVLDENGQPQYKENGKMKMKRNWANIAKKAAVAGVVGFIPGVGLGLAGAAVISGVAGVGALGAAWGGAVGVGVTRGAALARVEAAANSRSVNDEQLSQTFDGLRETYYAYNPEDNDFMSPEDLTEFYTGHTEAISHANRRRNLGAAAIGAVSGAAGFGVGTLIRHAAGIGGHNGAPKPKAPTPAKPPVVPPTPKPPVVPPVAPPKGPSIPGDTTLPPAPTGDTVPVPPAGGGNAIPHYDFPYKWVQDTFKGQNATTKIHGLEDAARAAGHKVVLHNSGTRNEWVSIDGVSDSDQVISILNNPNLAPLS